MFYIPGDYPVVEYLFDIDDYLFFCGIFLGVLFFVFIVTLILSIKARRELKKHEELENKFQEDLWNILKSKTMH